MTRSSHKSQPVTPQRIPQPRQHRHSLSQSYITSPATPASPYTPLSLRSFSSSASGRSSTLTTPDHVNLNAKRLSFSPEVARAATTAAKDHSLADIAQNWRSRANENGIKVSSVHDDSHYGDDEASDRTLSDAANDSGFISTEEALLPPPFLSTHRRAAVSTTTRPRAQSHVPLPIARAASLTFASPPVSRNNTRVLPPPTSPLVARRLNQSQNLNSNNIVTATPPPNRALARQLKLKGSLTDPAHTRRREEFGAARTPSKKTTIGHTSLNLSNVGLNQDTSLDLFDIDENENEFEYDYNYETGNQEPSFELDFRADGNSMNLTNSAYGYPTYTIPPPSHHQQQQQQQYFPSSLAPAQFSDPFHAGGTPIPSSITDSVEHHFHAQQQQVFAAVPSNMSYIGGTRAPGECSEHHAQHHYPHQQEYAQCDPQQYLRAPPGIDARARPVATPASVPMPTAYFGVTAVAGDKDADRAKKRAASGTGNTDIDIRDHRLSHTSSSSPHAQMQMQIQVQPSPPSPRGQGCSVCLTPAPRTLAVLAPCGHPLCSACLTSALNIVGEKDMECAVCKRAVRDFRLVVGGAASTDSAKQDEAASAEMGVGAAEDKRREEEKVGARGKSFMDPLFSSPGSGSEGMGVGAGDLVGLESAFEFGFALAQGEGRASTPKLGDSHRHDRDSDEAERDVVRKIGAQERVPVEENRIKREEENVVLRIDNVPWDITPPQIQEWLQQPVERVHVLLDAKGKTMSHAYVEVADGRVAGAVLRGEVATVDEGGKKGYVNPKPNQTPITRVIGTVRSKDRGSVLGKGRRARGVTVTRSGQEELMADLFPNWKGTFDGSRPSLAGLDAERVIGALEGGLIGESEVVGLLHLIREPDSHFLKVPSLPFHSLISVLSKFPVDVDSRVFWSAGVRDMLYDVTYAAAQVLYSRIDRDKQTSSTAIKDGEYTMDLVWELVKTAIDCHAFTVQQINKFADLLESWSLTFKADHSLDRPQSGSPSVIHEPRTPETRLNLRTSALADGSDAHASTLNPRPVGDNDGEVLASLAREFGVEAQLVKALAQRLAGLC